MSRAGSQLSEQPKGGLRSAVEQWLGSAGDSSWASTLRSGPAARRRAGAGEGGRYAEGLSRGDCFLGWLQDGEVASEQGLCGWTTHSQAGSHQTPISIDGASWLQGAVLPRLGWGTPTLGRPVARCESRGDREGFLEEVAFLKGAV